MNTTRWLVGTDALDTCCFVSTGEGREVTCFAWSEMSAAADLVDLHNQQIEALMEGARLQSPAPHQALRATFTNDVIRALGALARQQHVCREQDGNATFVTGMEAAREYIIEHVLLALGQFRAGNARACENYRFSECVDGVNYCVCNWVDIAHTFPTPPAETPAPKRDWFDESEENR